jgi:hypothetical protein
MRALAVLVLAAVLAGCSRQSAAPVALGPITPLEFPATDSSLAPRLAAAPDGALLAIWFEKLPEGRRALKLARFADGTWDSARIVAESDSFFVNWADVPALLAGEGGRLAIAYPWRSAADPYAYDVRVIQSSDGGATWSTPVTPHRDGTATEHGFVSLAHEGNSLRAVWLDGRKSAEKAAHEGHGEHQADMTLRTAMIGASGELAEEAVLDERTCDCCPTSMIVTASGPVLAYRDRGTDEVRDFSVTRFVNGTWTAPVPLHADGWKIEGCPVNGAALNGAGDHVVAAWYTEAGDRPMVYFARSSDGGATFGPPIAVTDTSTLGRADALTRDDGASLVSWIEKSEGTGRIMVRTISADGALGAPTEIARTTTRRASGMPHMARSGSQVVFVWTEAAEGQPTRVRSAAMEWR